METRAYDRLVEKAKDLQKPTLTEAQAFAKVYLDPANRELAQFERKASRDGIAPMYAKRGEQRDRMQKAQTAMEAITAKAEELRLHEPSLTREQAFAKAYQDPANREIVKRERAESHAAIGS